MITRNKLIYLDRYSIVNQNRHMLIKIEKEFDKIKYGAIPQGLSELKEYLKIYFVSLLKDDVNIVGWNTIKIERKFMIRIGTKFFENMSCEINDNGSTKNIRIIDPVLSKVLNRLLMSCYIKEFKDKSLLGTITIERFGNVKIEINQNN